MHARWWPLVLFVAFSCAEEGPGAGPARDAGTASDTGMEADAGSLVDSGANPSVRTLVEHHIIPARDERNQFVAPDFESKLPSTAWIGYDLDPAATQLAAIRRSFEARTPSPRSEVLLIPGTDAYPATVSVFGFAWVTGTGFTASVWLGYPVSAGEAPFNGQEVKLYGFEVGQGSSVVDLAPDPDQVEFIGDVRWQRFSATASGRFVGRLMVSVQNFGSDAMRVNGPTLRSATSVAGGVRPRAVSASDRALLSKVRARPDHAPAPSPLDPLGLPAQLFGGRLTRPAR